MELAGPEPLLAFQRLVVSPGPAVLQSSQEEEGLLQPQPTVCLTSGWLRAIAFVEFTGFSVPWPGTLLLGKER